MSVICSSSNWATAARTAKGLGLCIRPEGHPWVHRDCFGQTWPQGAGDPNPETEEQARRRFARETGGHSDDAPLDARESEPSVDICGESAMLPLTPEEEEGRTVRRLRTHICVRSHGHQGGHRSKSDRRWDHLGQEMTSHDPRAYEPPPNEPGHPRYGLLVSYADAALTHAAAQAGMLSGPRFAWGPAASHAPTPSMGTANMVAQEPSDWAKDDDEAYRAVVRDIQADHFKVLHVTNDDSIYPTGEVPKRTDFMVRANAYAPREDRAAYSMAGAQRALSEERERREHAERVSDEVAKHCTELEQKIDRQAGNLQAYGDEIDRLREELRKAQEHCSRLSAQVADGAEDHAKLSALEGHPKAIVHQRDQNAENVRVLRQHLQQAEGVIDVERARANRAIQRAEEAEARVREHAETISDHVALNNEQSERIAQMTSRMRSLLCVEHVGAVLPRCAKCLYDELIKRDRKLADAEREGRKQREQVRETLERLKGSTEGLTVQIAGIMAEAAPLLRNAAPQEPTP